MSESNGQPVKETCSRVWTSGGPAAMWRHSKGMIVPIERSLAGDGFLPNHTGTFTVSMLWKAFRGKDDTCHACQISNKLRFYEALRCRPLAPKIFQDHGRSKAVHTVPLDNLSGANWFRLYAAFEGFGPRSLRNALSSICLIRVRVKSQLTVHNWPRWFRSWAALVSTIVQNVMVPRSR
jgi:hypothetical protein